MKLCGAVHPHYLFAARLQASRSYPRFWVAGRLRDSHRIEIKWPVLATVILAGSCCHWADADAMTASTVALIEWGA
jgi:hypothetical protein